MDSFREEVGTLKVELMRDEAIDINDAPDRKAKTLAQFIQDRFLRENEYLENIRLAASRLTRAGLGDMLYVTQYSSGSTVWKMDRESGGIIVYTDGTVKL